ncbi:hypothetical protein Pelo_18719 [Pelomyxa schiedti]|nr:hypothetical protein Pelo_18719 [Pelomyxa schiedti]
MYDEDYEGDESDHDSDEDGEPPKVSRSTGGAATAAASAPPSPPPPYRPTIVPLPPGMSCTTSACRIRDLFLALLMSTHPRCGGSETCTLRPSLMTAATSPCVLSHNSASAACRTSCTTTVNSPCQSSALWSALRVLWGWLVDFPSLFICLKVGPMSFIPQNTMVTFGISPLTGSITHDVSCWNDDRPTSTLVSVNTHSAVSLFRSPRGWCVDTSRIATGERLGLWEERTPVTLVATGKWLLGCLGRVSHLSVTPTYGSDAGARCLVEVPRAMPRAYHSSDTKLSLFFNHAVPDEAVLMLVGDSSQRRSGVYLANMRVIDVSRTWATKKFCEVSSTTCKFGASNCEIGFSVVLRKLSGAHVFVTILDDRYQSVVVIEEGTGIQTTVGTGNDDEGSGLTLVDTLCQLSSSLFCVAKHKCTITAPPGDPGSLPAVNWPTWYEIWDCNSRDFSRPLRTVQCPVGCTSMFAAGGFVCTVTRDSWSVSCVQVTDPSGIVVFLFKYPAHLLAGGVFSLLGKNGYHVIDTRGEIRWLRQHPHALARPGDVADYGNTPAMR